MIKVGDVIKKLSGKRVKVFFTDSRIWFPAFVDIISYFPLLL